MERMKKRKSKKSTRFFKVAIMLGILIVSTTFGYWYTVEGSNSDVLSEGVYIENISLGGKTPMEAEKLLREQYVQAVEAKKLQVKANNRIYRLDYSKLQPAFNIEEVVKEAYRQDKEVNLLEKLISKKTVDGRDLSLSFTYDRGPIEELVAQIKKDNNQEAVNAKITVVDAQVKFTSEVDGLKLQEEKLKQAIISQINGDLVKEPSVIEATFERVKPEITYEKLSAINTVVASFSTSFTTSTANRINNIELATKAINGTVLMPGESFSFNKTVGQRTKARGYKEAGVIIGDKIESGVGGGICQVSSTLYNAVLTANLGINERRNHSLPLSYVGKGLDATVNWGSIDFSFKNSYDTPIYIEGYIKDKKVYFNIYADKGLDNRTYEMVTDVYETIVPDIKYIDNPNWSEGVNEVTKKASNGYKVKVYRKTFENGKLINTEVVSNDFYKPVNGEILRGTKS